MCLMFDSQALAFHNHLDGFRGDPRVAVATSINPKIIGATLPSVLKMTHLEQKSMSTRKLILGKLTFT
ncbi:hypothetical protein HID58_079964, partial [Brassica napus]